MTKARSPSDPLSRRTVQALLVSPNLFLLSNGTPAIAALMPLPSTTALLLRAADGSAMFIGGLRRPVKGTSFNFSGAALNLVIFFTASVDLSQRPLSYSLMESESLLLEE